MVVARRSWLEFLCGKLKKGRKKEKEHTRKERKRSKQPSSTAEIR
jgi:hypothetical protein